MLLHCRPLSPIHSRAEAAELPKPEPLADANPEAAHAHPQPAPAEVRSRGTPTALLPAREGHSALPRRQAERRLPVLQSGAHSRCELSPPPGSRSKTEVRRSVLGSAWADHWLLATESLAAADIRTRAVPPYPHDRVVRNETRAGRWL